MCKATPNIQIPNAIFGINGERYVDKSIKLIEKVPELLVSIGFWKSSFIFSGYNINLDIINIKNIRPIVAHMAFKRGCVSFKRFPSENNARITPHIGRGIFSIMILF